MFFHKILPFFYVILDIIASHTISDVGGVFVFDHNEFIKKGTRKEFC